ncbi:MAG: hypothetical protein CL816_04025 [Coxiellaceae bacterium]|nr:hypothetical protein [Coxiellaceae bacterium]
MRCNRDIEAHSPSHVITKQTLLRHKRQAETHEVDELHARKRGGIQELHQEDAYVSMPSNSMNPLSPLNEVGLSDLDHIPLLSIFGLFQPPAMSIDGQLLSPSSSPAPSDSVCSSILSLSSEELEALLDESFPSLS